MSDLDRIYNFMNEVGTYALATAEADQPKVRVFGTILRYNDKLYIQTGKRKDVAKQLFVNPKAEIVCSKGTEWLRVSCELVEADDRNIRVAMLNKMPDLRMMYNEDDGNMVMFELKNVVAIFSSFTSEPEIIKL